MSWYQVGNPPIDGSMLVGPTLSRAACALHTPTERRLRIDFCDQMQVVALHGKSTKDASVPDVKRDMVAARARLERHNARLVQARLEHEKAEAELLKSQWKLEQEEAMRKRMQDDLASFNEELREQEENQSRASAEQQRKRDIKARNEAQKKVVDKVHNQELIRDVSDQLKE